MASLPVNHMIKQLFFLDKCGITAADKKRFYMQCRQYPEVTNDDVNCVGILGSKGECWYNITFTNKNHMRVHERCNVGKITVTNHELDLETSQVDEIAAHCAYVLEGRPFPLWAIILIVVGVLLVSGLLGYLIWNYWVKKRWYPDGPDGASAIESRWTDSPFSSTSALGNSRVAAGASSQRPLGGGSQAAAPSPSTFPTIQSANNSGGGALPANGGPSASRFPPGGTSNQVGGGGGIRSTDTTRSGIERTIRSLLNRPHGSSNTGRDSRSSSNKRAG